MKEKLGVGLIGSKYISSIHAEAFRSVHNAQVVAAFSPTEANVKSCAKTFSIPAWYTQLDDLLADKNVDMIVIAAPNNGLGVV